MRKARLATRIFNILHSSQHGFSLVEVILASSLFILLVTALVGAYLYGQEATALAGHRARAVMLAEEGLEAVRNIRDARFRNLNLIDGTYGLTIAGNKWFFTGLQDVSGIFTRTITISSIDAKRKSITSTVVWQQNAQRTGTVQLGTYLTNWGSSSQALTCNWSGLSIRDTFNSTTNTHDAVKVQTDGQYAYLAYTDAGSDAMDFAIVDTQGTPTLIGSLNLLGSQKDIAISGNYAYIASDVNTAELQIVDITNPNAPVARGVFDATGSADGKGVFVVGTTVYLVRDGGTDPEFYIVNASNPDSPSVLGSADLGGNTHGANSVYVSGNFAYVSSISNTQEVKVVNISSPSTPVFSISDPNYSYDIPADSNDGIGLTGFSSYVIVGNAAGIIHILDTHTSPPYLTYRSTYVGNDQVNDLALGEGNQSLFVASNNNVNEEFEVVNISNIDSPVATGALDNSAPFFGVAFAEDSCTIYAVGSSLTLTPELWVLAPTSGGGDTTAPAAITDLALSGASGKSILLTWTAPGDDGTTGTAASYDIRYSTATITEANFASATQVTGEPAPQVAGTSQSMRVSGLDWNTTYFFAIKTADEVPNTSAISNVPSTATRTQASYLVVNTASARSDAPTDNTRIINITIENSATEAAESSTINQMSATWSGAGNYRLNGIRINGTDYWTGTATKGTLVTLSPAFVLAPATSYPITYLDYNNNVIGLAGNVIRFVMADGSFLDSSSFTITQ